MLTIEVLHYMAESKPDEVALTEKDNTISYARLKLLVDKVSPELFEDSISLYAQHTENNTSRNITTLCADNVGINTLVNIKASTSKEMLSAMIKAGQVDVLYTDMIDKIWKTADNFDLNISRANPIELFHSKIWKVKFRGNKKSSQIEDDEIKLRYNQWQELQKDYNPPHPQ